MNNTLELVIEKIGLVIFVKQIMVSTEVLIHEGNIEDNYYKKCSLILNYQLERRRQTNACSNITLEDICMHLDSPIAALANKANCMHCR